MKIKSFYLLLIVSLAFTNCKEATTSVPAKTSESDIAARNKATFIKVNALYNEKKLDEAAQSVFKNLILLTVIFND